MPGDDGFGDEDNTPPKIEALTDPGTRHQGIQRLSLANARQLLAHEQGSTWSRMNSIFTLSK